MTTFALLFSNVSEAIATQPSGSPQVLDAAEALSFDAIYDAHFEFVWRSLARMGIRSAQLDDATQDVFIVVHRRLAEFVPRHSVKSWLFAIALRVARDYRRTSARKDRASSIDETTDMPASDSARTPERELVRAEAKRLLLDFLDTLEDEPRAVFVLMELEQLTAPEVARELSIDQRAVYTRREAARRAFDRFVREKKEAQR